MEYDPPWVEDQDALHKTGVRIEEITGCTTYAWLIDHHLRGAKGRDTPEDRETSTCDRLKASTPLQQVYEWGVSRQVLQAVNCRFIEADEEYDNIIRFSDGASFNEGFVVFGRLGEAVLEDQCDEDDATRERSTIQ